MKLYTEEQVRQAIKMADKYHHVLDSEETEIVSILEPIELPSDEEIQKESYEEIQKEAYGFYGLESYMKVFVQGAKYMRDKLQGGNK